MGGPEDLEILTDSVLLARARRSSAAFRVLYDRHVAMVHGFHRRRTGDATAALELTAETFAQAWLSRERYTDRGDGSAAGWLLGIGRNVLAGSVRRRAIEHQARERIGLAVEPYEAAPDDGWLDGMDDDLAAQLAALPHSQRRAIELRIIEDRGYDDVARSLACSQGAARVRVHRGLVELRRRLAPGAEG
jgi:RNA polymerase sigma factor (sigma-70 family)